MNHQLNKEEVYLPLVLGDERRNHQGSNDWAKGLVTGTYLRHEIWSELIDDEENSGPIAPIMALAYENHPDPDMRPFKEPVDDEKRQELMIGSAAGVMRVYACLLKQRDAYLPGIRPLVRMRQKIGRNAPCPCGSGLKYKKCCGSSLTLH